MSALHTIAVQGVEGSGRGLALTRLQGAPCSGCLSVLWDRGVVSDGACHVSGKACDGGGNGSTEVGTRGPLWSAVSPRNILLECTPGVHSRQVCGFGAIPGQPALPQRAPQARMQPGNGCCCVSHLSGLGGGGAAV